LPLNTTVEPGVEVRGEISIVACPAYDARGAIVTNRMSAEKTRRYIMTSPLKTKFQTPQARGCESAQIHSKKLPCTWHDNPTHRRQERANGVQREARDERTIASDFFECQGRDSREDSCEKRTSVTL
jgi:hypothetical protein